MAQFENLKPFFTRNRAISPPEPFQITTLLCLSFFTNYWSVHPVNFVLTDTRTEIPITVSIIEVFSRVSAGQCFDFKTTRCFQGPVPKTTTPICHPQLVVHWTGTGWFEFFTHWKPYKRVRSRGHGMWACLAHALQCSFNRCACCPALFFIFRFWGFTGTVICCFNLLFHWTGTGWFEVSTIWKPYKPVRARGHGTWEWLAHALQCLYHRCTFCPALSMQLVIFVYEVPLAPATCCSLDWYGLVWIFRLMEIVQADTGTWPWCVSMFAACFAVFLQCLPVLSTPFL